MTQERKGMKDVVVIVLCQTRRVESIYALYAKFFPLCRGFDRFNPLFFVAVVDLFFSLSH